MNTPINHHYVPKHFLAAWATDKNRKLINRYICIPCTGEVKFKKSVGIRSTASGNKIYGVTDGTGWAEFETGIMTQELDTPTAIILKKLRQNGLDSLGVGTETEPASNELFKLVTYIVALEVRHPKTIAKMEISPDDIREIGTRMPESVSSDSKKAVVEFVSKINIPTYAAGLMIANDCKFANILQSSFKLELKFSKSALYTSDFPVGRVGLYNKSFLLSIAVAPDRAIVWASSSNLTNAIKLLSSQSQARLVNFLTLGDADEVYTNLGQQDQFVLDNFSWKSGLNETEQKRRLEEFMKALTPES